MKARVNSTKRAPPTLQLLSRVCYSGNILAFKLRGLSVYTSAHPISSPKKILLKPSKTITTAANLKTSFKSSKFHSSWVNIILLHERCGHFGHFALPFGHFNESNESISEAASAMSTRMSDVTRAVESPGRFGKRHEPLQPS